MSCYGNNTQDMMFTRNVSLLHVHTWHKTIYLQLKYTGWAKSDTAFEQCRYNAI